MGIATSGNTQGSSNEVVAEAVQSKLLRSDLDADGAGKLAFICPLRANLEPGSKRMLLRDHLVPREEPNPHPVTFLLARNSIRRARFPRLSCQRRRSAGGSTGRSSRKGARRWIPRWVCGAAVGTGLIASIAKALMSSKNKLRMAVSSASFELMAETGSWPSRCGKLVRRVFALTAVRLQVIAMSTISRRCDIFADSKFCRQVGARELYGALVDQVNWRSVQPFSISFSASRSIFFLASSRTSDCVVNTLLETVSKIPTRRRP